jgi:hypothetical protein
MQDLRFYGGDNSCCGLLDYDAVYSGRWGTNVFEEHAASIFRVQVTNIRFKKARALLGSPMYRKFSLTRRSIIREILIIQHFVVQSSEVLRYTTKYQ